MKKKAGGYVAGFLKPGIAGGFLFCFLLFMHTICFKKVHLFPRRGRRYFGGVGEAAKCRPLRGLKNAVWLRHVWFICAPAAP